MDAEKHRVLIKIDYQVGPACGMCLHADIRADAMWGDCTFHHYEHEKHSGPERNLSVHAFGHCPDYFPAPAAGRLNGYTEFIHTPTERGRPSTA